MNATVKIFFIITAFSSGPVVMAQNSDRGTENDARPEQIGSENVQFQTSCDASAAEDFNRAVALMHSFWFAEAIETFDEVLAQDADCTMAHWGIALSHWGNPFAGQRNLQQLQRGARSVAQARSQGAPTERESAYIEAVAELFSDMQPGTQYARTLAYEDAMSELSAAFPDDMEAKIFYALAVNQTAQSSDKTYAQQLKAAQILEPLFEENPAHPGLAHYIIHAFDHPPLAERALGAARLYASLAPDAPHALHMPSHTFTRVGMWQDSVDTNLRSAQAARNDGDAGSELHALDYQAYAYLQMGRDQAAADVVARAAELMTQVNITAVGATQAGAFAIAAIPARYALEREDFAAAARLEVHPADTPHTQAMTHFARALGAARIGDTESAAQDVDMLATLRERAASNQDIYWAEQIDIQWQVARAWVAYADGNGDAAITMLAAAADAEDGTDKSAVSPGPLAPARELLAFMLLAADRPDQALQEFEATMAKEPNRFLALAGAAKAASVLGNDESARNYHQRLLEVAESADTDRPALQAARTHLTL